MSYTPYSRYSDHRRSTVMGIGGTLDIPLGFKRLNLTSQCRWMCAHRISEITHPHRTVIDDFAQNGNRCNSDCDTGPHGNQSVEALAASDPPE
jgi:hypothetical protein